MEAVGKRFVEGLEQCFAEFRDPRVQGRCDHLLIEIPAIALLAVMCGAEDWPDIEQFGKYRHDWLKTFLQLLSGIPSHDTFRRVFGFLDRQQFAACLFRWTQALHEATGGKVLAIDWKTARRSFAKKTGLLEIPPDHPQRAVWKDLRSLVVITSCREIDGEEHWETRQYITSHAPQAKLLAKAIRQHWGIENTQHWTFDLTFGEDSRRQQDRHGAANLAAVRRLVLSLLRQEKTNKRGVKNQRLALPLIQATSSLSSDNAQF